MRGNGKSGIDFALPPRDYRYYSPIKNTITKKGFLHRKTFNFHVVFTINYL